MAQSRDFVLNVNCDRLFISTRDFAMLQLMDQSDEVYLMKTTVTEDI
jgi:hypothetical protein